LDYQREWLRWDLMAGLVTAAVVIPKAMAYATIAALPVQVGLYTAGADGDLRGYRDVSTAQC
jgi:MFS superfamily sulfate permease-like transporter